MSLIGLLVEFKRHVLLVFAAQPQPAWSARLVFGTAFFFVVVVKGLFTER